MSTVQQFQEDRMDRARTALANGEIKFSPLPGGGWLVTNGDARQYAISADLSDCNCPDYEQRGKHMGFRCKHLEAARLLFSPPNHPTKGITTTMTETTQENGWVKLYHPAGVQVTLPVPANGSPVSQTTATSMFASVTAYLSAGFLTNAPGLEEGELMEEISAVARREGRDETPIIDFFSSNTRLSKKIMHAYLNAPEDMQAFEDATGMRLADIPTFPGAIAVTREDKAAGQYIKPLPRPIKVVYRINPKWEKWNAGEIEGTEPHKRLLVRYETGANAAPEPALASGTAKPAFAPPPAKPRLYKNGLAVNGDVNEQIAFDAFVEKEKKAPASKDNLKAWIALNPAVKSKFQPAATPN